MAENVGKNEKLERLAYEYQLLQAQAQLLSQNLELLTLARNELTAVKETLEGLKNMEGEKLEILVPIGGGSFLKGIIEDKDNAIISMGAGYSAERPLDEAVELIEKRIKEYDDAIVKTQEGLKKLEAQLQSLAKKAQELQG
ncbi:prefoldin subunit alpha [Thermococcus profundus]|uniref:Prefoldin subunit alpha n=1 Tax=Thermococcus profundus TaxID=49899 RepID=A0A2Z2ME92_THEPR|nr:prefoldin subunit alpha [Thermococcus profundus]ASJ03012.1 prefoldin subunit alpha [Thermococcus profundus]